MIDFEWPWVFLILPLPLVVRLLVPRAKSIGGPALRVPFFHSLRSMQQGIGGRSWSSGIWLALIAWILLVTAAAQPRWHGADARVPITGRNLMLVVDISGSMRQMDFLIDAEPADRLTVVKQVAGRFIEERKGDRVGLILFGAKPYLRSPLSFDRGAVGKLLDDAEIALAGEYTAIGDAIGLGIKRLREIPAESRVIVLLTDGSSNAGAVGPMQAARMALAYGIRIYTIGIGRQDVVAPNPYGVWSADGAADFDRELLEGVARTTGGTFFHALDSVGLEAVYRRLDQIEPVLSDELQAYRAEHLYPWPLGLAVVIGLWISFRKTAGFTWTGKAHGMD